MQDLLQLPIQIQAMLVAGYFGYVLLKRDHRKNENKADMALLVLVFGLPTALILQRLGYDNFYAYLSVFISPIIAFIWIKCLNHHWIKFLQKYDVSHNINEGDVWHTLSSHKGVAVYKIRLFHNDGFIYLCEATSQFNAYPFSPFIMDDDGIAFYVTHVWTDDVCKEVEGNMLRYFPREDIKFLDMEYQQVN